MVTAKEGTALSFSGMQLFEGAANTGKIGNVVVRTERCAVILKLKGKDTGKTQVKVSCSMRGIAAIPWTLSNVISAAHRTAHFIKHFFWQG